MAKYVKAACFGFIYATTMVQSHSSDSIYTLLNLQMRDLTDMFYVRDGMPDDERDVMLVGMRQMRQIVTRKMDLSRKRKLAQDSRESIGVQVDAVDFFDEGGGRLH